MSNRPIASSSAIPCPRCGAILPIVRNQNDVTCSCGFSAFTPYVLEAHYLRAGLPAWQARLAELDSAIDQGLRPENFRSAPPVNQEKKPAGAYQYLVGGGALLLFAGIAAFVGIMWKVLGIQGQAAVLVAITITLMIVAVRLSGRIATTARAFALLTVGSWLINLGWLVNRIGFENKLVTTLTIPAAYSVITALLFSFAGRRFKNMVWAFIGFLAIPVSLGLVLTSAALNINESANISSTQLVGLALPLTVGLNLLANDSVVSRFEINGVQRLISLIVLSAFSIGFFVTSFVNDSKAGLAWAVHFGFLTIFATFRKGSEFLAPFTGAVVLGLSIEYALTSYELSAWVFSATMLPLSILQLFVFVESGFNRRFFPGKSKLIFTIFNLSIVFHYLAQSFANPTNSQQSLNSDPTAFYAWAIHLAILIAIAVRLERARFLAPFLIAGIGILTAGFTDIPVWMRLLAPLALIGFSLRTQKLSPFVIPVLLTLISTFWIVGAFVTGKADTVRYPSIVLSALAGLAVLYLAKKQAQAAFVFFAAPLLIVSVVLANQLFAGHSVERLTIPCGIVLVICGAVAFSIDGNIPSLVWLAPGSAIATIPSILKSTVEQEYSLRFILSISVAVALLIIGARLRFLGALVVGLIIIVVAVRNPLLFVFDTVPTWVTFTASGLLLILIGARFEHLRKRAGSAKEWVVGALR